MHPLRLALSVAVAGSLVLPAIAAEEKPFTNADDSPEETVSQAVISRVAASMAAARDESKDEVESLALDDWKRLYVAGKKDFDNRVYDDAENKLLNAIKAAKHALSNERKLIWARNALGDVYLAQDHIEEAEKLYSWCVGAARHAMGAESEAESHAQDGLASVLLAKGRYTQAQELCQQALKTRKKLLGATSHDYGQSLVTMACILCREGLNDEADRFMQLGLSVLQEAPGERALDYADALRQAALLKQRQGRSGEAQALFEQSYAIKDKSVAFDQTPRLKGLVRFQWEEGSPRSQEIPDREVPVRYLCTNGVRVACTVLDLWELFGLLISVTNVGDHRQEVGLGQVFFERTTGDPLDPYSERLEIIDPNRIDRVRREMDIWRLTQNRPWLENMQKTRNIRGLVPPHGHDLFRGPNVFGVYGEWGATTRVLPDKFQLEPSPERVEYQAQVVVDPSLVRTNNIKILGLTPVSLEPFESRTGELFYMNPRCEHVLLRISVGNAIFEFPFRMPKKRTSY